VAPNQWLNPQNGVSYQIAVQTPQYRVDSFDAIGGTPATPSSDTSTQLLGNLASLERTHSTSVVNHYNGQPVFDVYANADQRDLGGVAADIQKILNLAQAHAALENAQAQEELARLTSERYQVLVSHGAVSRQEADQQLAEYRTAQANVRLQEAGIQSAEDNVQVNRANLDRLMVLQGFEQVRAPFDGMVTARNFDVGALIQTSGGSTGASTTPMGGAGDGLALAHVAVDVFDFDGGVVHQDAHRQRQAAERHDVDGLAQQAEHDQRIENRKGPRSPARKPTPAPTPFLPTRRNFRKHKGAIKMHTLLDLHGNIPTFIRLNQSITATR
jgi:hypothetical protein